MIIALDEESFGRCAILKHVYLPLIQHVSKIANVGNVLNSPKRTFRRILSAVGCFWISPADHTLVRAIMGKLDIMNRFFNFISAGVQLRCLKGT
jgi:hypothetical protein